MRTCQTSPQKGNLVAVALALAIFASAAMSASGCGKTQSDAADASGNRDSSSSSDDASEGMMQSDDSGSPNTLNACSYEPLIFQFEPSANSDSCSTADIDALRAQVSTVPIPRMLDWYNAVSSNCRNCLFQVDSAPTWQLVRTASADVEGFLEMNNGALNLSACFALTPGGTTACAAAIEKENDCIASACPAGCDGSQDASDECSQRVCAGYSDAIAQACGPARASLDAACGGEIWHFDPEQIVEIAREICSVPSDAGG